MSEHDDAIERPRRDSRQAYFWSETWQEAEREAQADIEAGRTKRFGAAADLIAELQIS